MPCSRPIQLYTLAPGITYSPLLGDNGPQNIPVTDIRDHPELSFVFLHLERPGSGLVLEVLVKVFLELVGIGGGGAVLHERARCSYVTAKGCLRG